MEIRGAIDALIDRAVDVIVGDFEQAAGKHRATQEDGATLRNQATARALLGAALDDGLTKLAGEARRRATTRYNACRLHPRYSSDPLIHERDDAEATLQRELLVADGQPTLGLLLALIRVEAVTAALGDMPMAGSKTPRARSGGPLQRRRPIEAGDVPDDLAQLVFAAARADDPDPIVMRLTTLERTKLNLGAIVTKVRVAFQRDGPSRMRELASGLRAAGVEERPLPEIAIDHPDEADERTERQPLRRSPFPAPQTAPPFDRRSTFASRAQEAARRRPHTS